MSEEEIKAVIELLVSRPIVLPLGCTCRKPRGLASPGGWTPTACRYWKTPEELADEDEEVGF